MSLFSNTLSVVRQNLSSSVGDLIMITPSTVSSTTAVSTMLLKGNDYYNEHGYTGYCYAGTGSGQEREVSDWTITDHTLTFDPAFSPALASGDKLELHHIFTEDEYRRAINLAIDSLADAKYLLDLIDTLAITLVEDIYEYTLPTNMYYIHRIITEHDAAGGVFENEDEIDPRDWELISPRKIKLNDNRYSITADKDLRIEGQGKQDTATSDTSVIKLPMDWLVQKAITFLPKNKIQSNQLDATYKQALVLAYKEPRRWPDPRGKMVIE